MFQATSSCRNGSRVNVLTRQVFDIRVIGNEANFTKGESRIQMRMRCVYRVAKISMTKGSDDSRWPDRSNPRDGVYIGPRLSEKVFAAVVIANRVCYASKVFACISFRLTIFL